MGAGVRGPSAEERREGCLEISGHHLATTTSVVLFCRLHLPSPIPARFASLAFGRALFAPCVLTRSPPNLCELHCCVRQNIPSARSESCYPAEREDGGMGGGVVGGRAPLPRVGGVFWL